MFELLLSASSTRQNNLNNKLYFSRWSLGNNFCAFFFLSIMTYIFLEKLILGYNVVIRWRKNLLFIIYLEYIFLENVFSKKKKKKQYRYSYSIVITDIYI